MDSLGGVNQCYILYSTQSGRAKACARRSARLLAQLGIALPNGKGTAFDEATPCLVDHAPTLGDNGQSLLLLFVSTTGDGEHTVRLISCLAFAALLSLYGFYPPFCTTQPYYAFSFAPGWYPKNMEATVSEVSREFHFLPLPFHDVAHFASVCCGALDFKNLCQRTCFVAFIWRCFPWVTERMVRKSFA
jgi:hypothetical protein